jgi:hypothetical protein
VHIVYLGGEENNNMRIENEERERKAANKIN